MLPKAVFRALGASSGAEGQGGALGVHALVNVFARNAPLFRVGAGTVNFYSCPSSGWGSGLGGRGVS